MVFMKGIVIGFSIAAPVGPIGLLCIRRTLAQGMATGFITGLGAAAADAIYGIIAACGITLVSHFLLDHQLLFRLAGGTFLIYLGYTTLHSEPANSPAFTVTSNMTRAFLSTFFLTLTNPMTIMSFAGVFAGLGAGSVSDDGLSVILTVLGVFSGSICWWLILSSSVACLREKLDARSLRLVNRLAGCIIGVFGLISLTGFLKEWLAHIKS